MLLKHANFKHDEIPWYVKWLDFGFTLLSVKRENFIKYGLLAKYGFDDGNDEKTNNDALTAVISKD